ncbi:MAG TPA: hypothetical protein VJW76_00650 [Verrucomicrobiae bacterium]|nr:hypothetical protein [Verrucomicrobiae bacterium]
MKSILKWSVVAMLVLGDHASVRAELETNSLPKVDDLLKRVLERAQEEVRNDREFKARYAFTRTKVREYRNSQGKLKSRQEKRIESNPPPQVLPVAYEPSPADANEDSITAGKELRQDPNGDVKGQPFKKSDFPVTDELLKRFRFELAGRETIDGRAALVVDFKPASKNLPVRNFKDRFINKAAGRVWVDEGDAALVKADVHLTESVSVVGGLVGAVHKCRYAFQRGRTPEGLWFTSQIDWRVEGRQVFTTKSIDGHERRTNVRNVW